MVLLCRFLTSLSNRLSTVSFYDQGDGSPCAFQLWFLRDLILIVATSPIWYLLLRYLKWLLVVISFCFTYLHIPFVPFYALFWFLLGGQLVQVRNRYGGGKSYGIYNCDISLFISSSTVYARYN